MTNLNSIILTNFSYNKYLSDLDLLYKYSLKTTFKIPFINQIKCVLNIKKILPFSGLGKQSSSLLLYKNLYFFFFIWFSIIPYIKTEIPYNKETNSTETNYNLMLQFNTFKQLNNFLFFYFIESWKSLVKKGCLPKLDSSFCFINSKNEYNLFTKIPLSILTNYETFYTSNLNNLIKEDSYIYISFKFKNLNTSDKKKAIKNLQFFWKSL